MTSHCYEGWSKSNVSSLVTFLLYIWYPLENTVPYWKIIRTILLLVQIYRKFIIFAFVEYVLYARGWRQWWLDLVEFFCFFLCLFMCLFIYLFLWLVSFLILVHINGCFATKSYTLLWWNMWCDQAKWVLCRALSNFSFVIHL